MRLNIDLIRDILLTVEENTDFDSYYEYTTNQQDKRLKKYSHEEIIYHLNQCNLAELIIADIDDSGSIATVSDLTPKGHEFLANIRENKIWRGIKNIAKEVGSTSLSAIIQISSNVITELIKAQFGLPSI